MSRAQLRNLTAVLTACGLLFAACSDDTEDSNPGEVGGAGEGGAAETTGGQSTNGGSTTSPTSGGSNAATAGQPAAGQVGTGGSNITTAAGAQAGTANTTTGGATSGSDAGAAGTIVLPLNGGATQTGGAAPTGGVSSSAGDGNIAGTSTTGGTDGSAGTSTTDTAGAAGATLSGGAAGNANSAGTSGELAVAGAAGSASTSDAIPLCGAAVTPLSSCSNLDEICRHSEGDMSELCYCAHPIASELAWICIGDNVPGCPATLPTEGDTCNADTDPWCWYYDASSSLENFTACDAVQGWLVNATLSYCPAVPPNGGELCQDAVNGANPVVCPYADRVCACDTWYSPYVTWHCQAR